MDSREAKRKAEARRRVIATQRVQREEKREFGFFSFLVITLFIAILVVAIYILCYVREITVENNQYSSTETTMNWMEEDPFIVNSVATFIKYNYLECELPDAIKSLEVQMTTPWSIMVIVEDKIPIGGFLMEDKYVYCDEEGTVILVTSTQVGDIPLIEGIAVSEYTLYETLAVDDVDIFENALEVSTVLDEYEILVDTISNGTGASVSVTIEGIEILLGEGDYQEKIAQIEAILGNLEGEEGTLDLSNFSTTNTTISFVRNNSEDS